MSVTIERPRVHGPGSGVGGPWRVIVRNDSHNTFDHVAETLAAIIPEVSLAHGYEFANRIHRAGLAVVWSGDQDQAQRYWEELRAAGLTMAPLESG